jgi:hypothetical protein
MLEIETKNGIKKLRKKVTKFLSMKPIIQQVSMTDADAVGDTHYPDEGVKEKCEKTDIESYLNIRIRSLLDKSNISGTECDDAKVIGREVMTQNVDVDGNVLRDSSKTDDCESKDGNEVLPPSIEVRGSVPLNREDSLNIQSPYYHIDINDINVNEDVDNDNETYRRSRAITVVDIIEVTVKKASHFLSQIPEAAAPNEADLLPRHKAISVEDELEAFKIRPITRKRMSSIASSGDNSLTGVRVLGDQDPEVKERVFLAIKNETKKRLKEETISSSRENSFAGLETEKDQENSQCSITTTIVPRATIFVNDADIKNAFREELNKNINILDSPHFPRVSAFPFRYET